MTDTPEEQSADSAEVAEASVPEPEMLGCPMTESRGQLVLHVDRDRYVDVAKQLADEGYAMCVDLTAVDYLNHMGRELPASVTAERFEVVVNLLDITHSLVFGCVSKFQRPTQPLQPCSTSTREPKQWNGKCSTCLEFLSKGIQIRLVF